MWLCIADRMNLNSFSQIVCILSFSARNKINQVRPIKKLSPPINPTYKVKREHTIRSCLKIHTCPHCPPFGIMLYLAMYITGHVHMRHSSIALGGSATHPKLGRGWALGWVWSARPLEGSVEGGFVIGSLSGGSSAVICRDQVVGVSQNQRVTLYGWVWQL